MTKAQLETKLRNTFLNFVTEQIQTAFDTDVLAVSASELAIPTLDEEGNEKFVLIKISIPRGTRNGQGGYDPYDGYAVAEDYAQDCVEKAAKKADAEAKKQAKIARDEKARSPKPTRTSRNSARSRSLPKGSDPNFILILYYFSVRKRAGANPIISRPANLILL